MKKIFIPALLTLLACGSKNADQKISETDADTVVSIDTTEFDGSDYDTTRPVGTLPKPWIKAGSKPELYEMNIDRKIVHSGGASAFIRSVADSIPGFGTMMQSCPPGKYRGKRVKFSGYVKSEDVTDWAGMWLRMDGFNDSLGFDNMQDRAIKGSVDWTLCEIVLDVPQECTSMNFGVLLSGKGTVWFDDFSFEVVSKEVPITGKSYDIYTISDPSNLDFELK